MKKKQLRIGSDSVLLIVFGLILLAGSVLTVVRMSGKPPASAAIQAADPGRDTGTGGVSSEAQELTETLLPAASTEPGVLRIATATDLHLDPDNTDHSGEASETAYSLELVDALLWDVRQKGADFLLLTGDLVNGGKPHRHEAMTEKLRQAEAEGLPVYVIPGNHDLAPVTQTEFAEYYADFGYGEAADRDPVSLSYSIVRDDLMLLMLDTAGYPAGAIDLPGAPERTDNEAFFSEGTLGWIETQLKDAQTQGLRVLCAAHYNLLSPYSRMPGSGFYVENGDRLANLLQEYGVPLYLSGHMHMKAVYQTDGLTELLTEFLLSYPTGYSLVDVTGRELQYTPTRVDVQSWAETTGQQDPVLLDFDTWQQEALQSYCESAVSSMVKRNPLRKDEEAEASRFFYTVMLSYWDGVLPEKRDALEVMAGCQPFFRCAEGYSYGWWLRELIDTATPLLRGFTLRWEA